ncbi:hypothetical protein QE152_g29354 [Popillia japonica]|uniref:Uncharacterized protein n=1 Tax=Popillia japonica TaxID=7064 RepID=A0AAW1JHY5_POPJA
MTLHTIPPNELQFEGNMAENWSFFSRQMNCNSKNRIHLRSTKGQSQNTRQVYTNYDIPPTLVTHYGNTRTETLNPVNADNVDNKGNIQQTRSGRHIKAPTRFNKDRDWW